MHVESKKDVLGNVIIDDFRGEYFFLSNFYLREITFHGIKFHSTEQAYMWCKTQVPEEQAAILALPTPGQVKLYCSEESGKITLREGWDNLRTFEMYNVVLAKFDQHTDLAERLIATEDALLIEGNWWHDNFWGDCTCGKKEECKMPGRNMLGQIHMKIRAKLMETK